MSTVEVVIGTPILLVFIVAMVYLGLWAQNVAQVQDAAQDAARMASLQRSTSAATDYAGNVAVADLGATCNASPEDTPAITQLTTSVDGAGTTLLTVTVECSVSEFGVPYTIDRSSTAPVDTYFGGQP